MNPENWQKIKAIFNEAVELSTDECEAFLNNQNGTDIEILAEVRRLIDAEKHNNFAEPVANLSQLWQDEKAEDFLGRQIGNYKITKEIGRGGMGIVFEAVRQGEDFSQTVALKLLKRGMDSDAMLRRFRHERQILASLEHPNIARLLDGGMTDDGLQFFALEYVQGQPIDEYCDEKNLSVNERLRLFLQVCAAVSFAHSRLVVHRDLKPSNILVTPDGTVKLLDFGIAKILTPDEDYKTQTVTSLGMMTPAYASPEQIKGEIVTTASDIYSLGLILYELLTGIQAYNFPNNRPDEIARVICESEPPRPSSVVGDAERWSVVSETKDNRQRTTRKGQTTNPKSKIQNPKSLKGDLDNIILKSLRKEPARRYASVEQFAGDIRKHLDGLPVIARPDTFSYRFEKFISRNRVSVIAGVLIFLILVGGIAATSWQAVRAERQRALSEKRFNEVRQLANSVVFKYYNEAEKLTGSTHLREMMVADAVQYLDGLSKDSAGDLSLQKELGLTYIRIGKAQGRAYFANLGDSKNAVENYKKGIALLEPSALTTDDVKFQWDFVNSQSEISAILRRQGNIAEADAYLKKTNELNEKFLALKPNDPTLLTSSAYNYYYTGDALPVGLKENESVAAFLKCKSAAEKVLSSDNNHLRANNILAAAFQRLGSNFLQLARSAEEKGDEQTTKQLTEEAGNYFRQTTALGEKMVKLQPNDQLYDGLLLAAKFNMNEYFVMSKQYPAALETALEGAKTYEKQLKEDSQNLENKLNITYVYSSLSVIYLRLNEPAKAEQNYRQMIKLFDEMIATDAENFDYRQKRWLAAYVYADELLRAGQIEPARKIYTEEAAAIEKPAREKDAQFADSMQGFMLSKTADCDSALAKRNNLPLAEQNELHQKALSNYQESLKLWSNGGAQTSPGVSDTERIEIIKQKAESCRTALAKV